MSKSSDAFYGRLIRNAYELLTHARNVTMAHGGEIQGLTVEKALIPLKRTIERIGTAELEEK